MNNNVLRMGVSSKHYTNAYLEFLSKLGWESEHTNSRNYYRQLLNSAFDIDLFLMNTHDIPLCIDKGYLDIGVLQKSVIEEERVTVTESLELPFGIGEMVIAVPKNSCIKELKDLNHKIIATRNPNITKRFFSEKGMDVEIFKVSKGTEVFPHLSEDISGMVEYRKTGETIRANNLVEIQSIMKSSLLIVEKKATPLCIEFCNQARTYIENNNIPNEWIYV